ncbi:MAG: thiamine-phosphate kinase [Gammaproteobacteria bacterium]|nr:thiamine-phosphate kinase [Gammaproteobacteria bacterium]
MVLELTMTKMHQKGPTFEHLARTCLFCDPHAHGQGDQVILVSDHFYLFAGVGAVIEGYIIIAPHRCDDPALPLGSLSDVPRDLMDELAYLRLIVAEFYRRRYGKEILTFEHGRTGTCLVPGETQHCYHAHLCCYPFEPVKPQDMEEEKAESVPENSVAPLWEDATTLNAVPIGDLHDLPAVVGESPYLLFEGVVVDDSVAPGKAGRESWEHRVVRLVDDHTLERQFLRRLLAARIGEGDLWDWLAHPMEDRCRRVKCDFIDFARVESAKYAITFNGDVAQLDFLASVHAANIAGNNAAAPGFARLWGNRLQHTAFGAFLDTLEEHIAEVRKTPGSENHVGRVLDGGCGPGNYSRAFYFQGYECIASDSSTAMLKLAKSAFDALEKLPAHANPPPEPSFVLEDARIPSFEKGSFDGIWYSAIVVHVPRSELEGLLQKLHALLADGGVLYLSAQLDGGTNQRVALRADGRVFFYYSADEIREAVRASGFEVTREWDAVATVGSQGDKNCKQWRNLILRRRSARLEPLARTKTLGDLGEAAIHDRIIGRLGVEEQGAVELAAGDDCAALQVPEGESLVVSVDPCPLPVLSMLRGERDMHRFGWFSMIIGLSDLAAMGARPLGMLLAIEAEESTPVADLDAFYTGALEASREFGCPILGGNVKDGPALSCVGTALGSVRSDRKLLRRAARPGERVLVLGEMGRFWAGVLAIRHGIALEEEALASLLEPLSRPRPRVAEGLALAEGGLSRCAMDSSDGLTACFAEIATRSGVDLNIDLDRLDPSDTVSAVAKAVGVGARKLMIGWGDWQLVCTAERERLEEIHKVMAGLVCPVTEVGWVSEGTGLVWAHDGQGRRGLLGDFASTRFNSSSYFTHGLEDYEQRLLSSHLFAEENV